MKLNYKTLSAFTALLLAGCSVREEYIVRQPQLSFGIINPEPWGLFSRSVLQGGDIEDRVTSINYGVYVEGKLYGTAPGDCADEGMAVFPYVGAVSNRSFDVCAIVNMPGFSFPEDETDLEACTYTVPGYLRYCDDPDGDMSIETCGMPMAGRITIPASTPHDGLFEVPVKRLLAKVRVEIETDIPDAMIGSAAIHDLNKVLSPFGESKPGGAQENLLPFPDSESGILSNHGSFTFYVPENLSGEIAAPVNSAQRQPEGYSANTAVLELLDNNYPSYLETEILLDGIYGGSITVRSYIGKNNSTDFNIERNCRYLWNLHINEDGTLGSSTWKLDGTGMEDRRYARFKDDGSGYFYVESGESLDYMDMVVSNMSQNALLFEWETSDGLDIGEDGFTVRDDAEQMDVNELSVKANNNYPGSPFDITGVAIVSKLLTFDSGVTVILPDKLTDRHPVAVNYSCEFPEDEWNRLFGKRGKEWNISGNLPSDYFLPCSFDDTGDIVLINPNRGIRPGSYTLGITKYLHPELPGGSDSSILYVPEVRFGFSDGHTAYEYSQGTPIPTRMDLYYDEGDLDSEELLYIPLVVGNVNRNGSVSVGSCWRADDPEEISNSRITVSVIDLSDGNTFSLLVLDEEEMTFNYD